MSRSEADRKNPRSLGWLPSPLPCPALIDIVMFAALCFSLYFWLSPSLKGLKGQTSSDLTKAIEREQAAIATAVASVANELELPAGTTVEFELYQPQLPTEGFPRRFWLKGLNPEGKAYGKQTVSTLD